LIEKITNTQTNVSTKTKEQLNSSYKSFWVKLNLRGTSRTEWFNIKKNTVICKSNTVLW
jgi:hypothetical protein